jgi:hypothetical protein
MYITAGQDTPSFFRIPAHPCSGSWVDMRPYGANDIQIGLNI